MVEPNSLVCGCTNLTAITDNETGSKNIMQNEWEALMVIGASAKPVEVK
jgi:hypothetical protein